VKFPFRIHRRRLVRRVTLGLAIVAVAAPSAQALSVDPATLPCAPSCTAGETQSVLHAGTGTPRTVTIPPELSGRQFGPGATDVTPAVTSTVTIPESLSGRQLGPTSAGVTPAVVGTTAVPMRGARARFAHGSASGSDTAAVAVAIAIAALLAGGAAAMAFRHRRGDLAHA
jgi:hypothetical protein